MLPACTFRSLILNYTDTFLIAEIESAFEPTSDQQESLIKKEVEQFWLDVRCKQLKDLEKDLVQVSSFIKLGISKP